MEICIGSPLTQTRAPEFLNLNTMTLKKKVVLEMDKKITLIYSFSILLRMKMCRYGSIPNRYPTFHKGGFLENVFNKSERGKN